MCRNWFIAFACIGVLAMSVVVSGRTGISVQTVAQDDRHELANTVDPLNVTENVTWASGDAMGQIDLQWYDAFTLAPLGTHDIDLYNLVDRFGNAVHFDRVKLLYIRNRLVTPTGPNIGMTISSELASGWTNWLWSAGGGGTVWIRGNGSILFQDDIGIDVLTVPNAFIRFTAGQNTVEVSVLVLGN